MTAIGVSGTATAKSAAAYGIDRPLDVSDVAGTVRLGELLTDAERARLPDRVAQRRLVVDSTIDTATMDECCLYCGDPDTCDCMCCELEEGC